MPASATRVYLALALHIHLRYLVPVTRKIIGADAAMPLFQVLGSRCLTGSALLDCHVLKGFGIYMIGILGRPYCPEWKTEVVHFSSM